MLAEGEDLRTNSLCVVGRVPAKQRVVAGHLSRISKRS
jgi:hypothetical protein